MAQDREEVRVHTMNPVHRRGPVFYASLPRGTETPKGQGMNGEAIKHQLVSVLWDHVVAMDNPLWRFRLSSTSAVFPIQVVHDPLGKPHLRLGAHRGPAISFSEGGGTVWAALCGDESEVGLDVAGAVEFQGEYPFHRVFNAQELQHALNLAGGDLEKASALLWTVKEAVVKALGCAFHFVDPLQIHVDPSIAEDDGYTFPVRLSGKALARFPPGAGPSLWVRSFPQVKLWLSIAVLNRQIDTAVGESMPGACPCLAATRRMPHSQSLLNQADLPSSQRGDLE
ncbi:MAG TPA: 4'-phosphopantetheinyl transferase superfamily protein [Candidatus Binatia bacterium]|nr:4'-phosphopantetheinyl transferase superfamily protein [Candidatus Binatia bacterium]